ncbi:hypothetical protein [Phocaeicola faecium]|uniref:Uncharacterized protein n=1 Tax=Phocaeicola faecium TaxID=2762213 RepID=A0ABR8V8L8_9BACT|nr:hypothetical protein [Phocaeicola faecium]MBD8001055.1 hypothetical protein [Phocaeicola faecium]
MKRNVKLLLDFAKGNNPAKKRIRIYSVIDGRKKLMDEFPTDTPVSINIDVYATDDAQLQMKIKNESLNKNLQ